MSLDVRSLADNPSTLAQVPIFLGPLPSREPCRLCSTRHWPHGAQVVAAGLLRATR
jgi:hypothetical protein